MDPYEAAEAILRARRVNRAPQAVDSWRKGDLSKAAEFLGAPPPFPVPEGAMVLPVCSGGKVLVWALMDPATFSILRDRIWTFHSGAPPSVTDGENSLPQRVWEVDGRPPAPGPTWAVGFRHAPHLWDLRRSSMYMGVSRCTLAESAPSRHLRKRGVRPSQRFPGVYLWYSGAHGESWRAYLPDGNVVRSNTSPQEPAVECRTEEEAHEQRRRRMLVDGWLTGWTRLPPARPRNPAQNPGDPVPADSAPVEQGQPVHRCVRLCRALGECVPTLRWRSGRHVERWMNDRAERDPRFMVTAWLLEGLGTWFTRSRLWEGAGGGNRFDLEYAHRLWIEDGKALETENARRRKLAADERHFVAPVTGRHSWGPPLKCMQDHWRALEPWPVPDRADDDDTSGPDDDEGDELRDPAREDEALAQHTGNSVTLNGACEPMPVSDADGYPLPHECTRLCTPLRHCPLHLFAGSWHLLAWLRHCGVRVTNDMRWMLEGTGLFSYLHGHPRSNRWDPAWMVLLARADREVLGSREAPWPHVPDPRVHESWRRADAMATENPTPTPNPSPL